MPIPPEDRQLIFGADIDLRPFNDKLQQMAQSVTNFGINYTQQLQRLTQQQVAAGEKLTASQANLKSTSEDVLRIQKDLEQRKGIPGLETSIKNLNDELKKSIDLQAELTKEVEKNQVAYDNVGKQIDDVNKKLSARPPLPSQIGPVIPGAFTPPPAGPTQPPLNPIDPTALATIRLVKEEMDKLSEAVVQAKERIKELHEDDKEFQELTVFIDGSEQTLERYNKAVEVASASTEVLGEKIKHAQDTISTLKATPIEELPLKVAKTRQEFEDLSDVVTLAENKLSRLKPEDAGFDELVKLVEQGHLTLDKYTESIQGATQATTTFRTQMIAGQQALAKMVEEGKEGTQEFIDLQKHVAKLTQEYRIQHEQLSVLASETRALNFGKETIQAAVSGFEALTATTILFGKGEEEAQKKTLQLFAAMRLVGSVEELVNKIRKGSVIQTELMSAAQSVYTAVVGASTGALKAFRLALLGTGIGAAAIAIGFLISKYIEFRNRTKEAREEQKLMADVLKEANEEAGKQISTLKTLNAQAQDTTLPLQKRLEAVTELQKTFPDYFGNLTQEAILTGKVGTANDDLTKSIEAASRARAAKGKIDKIESDRLDLAQRKEEIAAAQSKNRDDQRTADKKDNRDKEQRGLDQAAAIAEGTRLRAEQQDIADKDAALQREEDFLTKFIGIQNKVPTTSGVQIRNKVFLENAIKDLDDQIKFAEIGSKKLADLIKQREALQAELDKAFPKKTTGRAVENIFEQEKAQLETKLAESRKDEVETIKKINDEFLRKLNEEKLRIAKEIKEGKLTKAQGKIILDLTVQLNKKQADEAIFEFTKKFKEEQERLDESIRAASVKAQTEQISLLRNEFESRSKLIEVNEIEELRVVNKAKDERLKKAEEIHRTELTSEEDFQQERRKIFELSEEETNNVLVKFARQREQLSFDIFKSVLQQSQEILHNTTAGIEHIVTEEIVRQSKLFQSGEISYKQFTDSITKTKLESDKKIRDASILETEEELLRVKLRIDTTRDTTSKSYKDLVALRKKLEEDLDKQRADAAEKDAKEIQDIKDKRIEAVLAWANAVEGIIQGVTEAFAEANRIEQQTLDRSIALQEKRVEEARRIAEKGNAEYLKQEQDRLKKLQVERENAAKRELAINAVVQESQALVAVISAIAQGAKTTGALGAAIDAAAIIALIASTYALVKSLSPPPPTFEKGTPFVELGKNKPGRDTVPAMLNEGEAVIPTPTNREYHPTVEAIYERSVPAKELNKFVTIYQKERDISKVINTLSTIHKNNNIPAVINRILTPGASELPILRHDKLQSANEFVVTHDGKLGALLEEQNRLLREDMELHRQTHHVLKHMGVDFKFDKEGVSVMLMKAIEKKKIDSKT